MAATALATTLILIAGVAPAAANPHLVGQWSFDEGAGQFAQDAGPFGLHGVLGSSTEADADDPLRVAGAAGGALRFGGSAYVRVADARRLDLQRLTVETVARAAVSPGAYRYLVAHGGQGCFAGAYGLYTAANGGLAFYVFDGERYFVSPSAAAERVWDGAWHRVTGTFDGRRVRTFVDGQEIGSGHVTPDGTAIETESMPEGTHFGSYVGACRLPFTGEMDSVRIWSNALAPAQVAAHAAATAASASPAPVAHAPLPPGARATVIRATLPKATCVVRASRKQIHAKRRVKVLVRATGPRRPRRRVRVSVRRTDHRKVLAAPRTNTRGIARVVLRVARSGRLRVGVVGRPDCRPAFIKIARRR